MREGFKRRTKHYSEGISKLARALAIAGASSGQRLDRGATPASPRLYWRPSVRGGSPCFSGSSTHTHAATKACLTHGSPKLEQQTDKQLDRRNQASVVQKERSTHEHVKPQWVVQRVLPNKCSKHLRALSGRHAFNDNR